MAIAQSRASTLDHYRRRKDELAEEEAKVHESLHPKVRSIVASKQILLFKEMLLDIEYDDMAVEGVELVGMLKPTGILKPARNEPSCAIMALWASARVAQAEVTKYRGEGERERAMGHNPRGRREAELSVHLRRKRSIAALVRAGWQPEGSRSHKAQSWTSMEGRFPK